MVKFLESQLKDARIRCAMCGHRVTLSHVCINPACPTKAPGESECSGAVFDRFDICEAHYILESDYNVSGVLQERPSNIRRRMSTGFQLSRMGFKPAPNLSYESMTDNGRAIYDELVKRYKLPE